MSSRGAADLVLGVDAGTTLCKAAVYAPDGRCFGAGEARQGIFSPEPGHAEQDPQSWWRALRRGVRAALTSARLPGERIAAIGLSTQGGTIAVFDSRGQPRGPALVWSDARQRATQAGDEAALDEHFQLTGLPHLNMTPAAVTWLKAHRPEWFAAPYRIGYVPDYLTFRLTGEWVSDPTNLTISNLCDLFTADIAASVIERLHLPRQAFAVTRRAGEVAGGLLPRAARALGLRAGIPIATPAHDQYAAALGAGCTGVGDGLLSAGTAWVVLLVSDRPILDRDSSFWPGPHLQPGRWGLMGAISSGSSTLDHMLALTRQQRRWQQVDAAAAAVPPGSDGLLVIPHLAGRTIPTWDGQARGAVLGWSLGHTREHLWRAAMEGVALETRVACDYLASQGLRATAIRMVGGAVRSPLWPRIVASVLAVPVRTSADEHMALRGAACLAARALGMPDLPPLRRWSQHDPIPEWRDCYQAAYARYREAIARLEGR
jgi:sugar (pentulose or hexulose) kinase